VKRSSPAGSLDAGQPADLTDHPQPGCTTTAAPSRRTHADVVRQLHLYGELHRFGPALAGWSAPASPRSPSPTAAHPRHLEVRVRPQACASSSTCSRCASCSVTSPGRCSSSAARAGQPARRRHHPERPGGLQAGHRVGHRRASAAGAERAPGHHRGAVHLHGPAGRAAHTHLPRGGTAASLHGATHRRDRGPARAGRRPDGPAGAPRAATGGPARAADRCGSSAPARLRGRAAARRRPHR